MNKEQFYNCLINTQQLVGGNTGQLNRIVNDFPYFQSARILFAMSLFKENDIRYDKELATTAIYAANRGVLKKHIYQAGSRKRTIVLPDEHLVERNDLELKKEEEIPIETKTTEKATDIKVGVKERIKDIEEKEEQKEASGENIKTKRYLIDQFIENEPSITRQKGTFFNPVTASKKSVTDQENIISETLAQIYLDQGYIDKAISTYEKLSLKYPEKSTYFAALIKKAEKNVNFKNI